MSAHRPSRRQDAGAVSAIGDERERFLPRGGVLLLTCRNWCSIECVFVYVEELLAGLVHGRLGYLSNRLVVSEIIKLFIEGAF